MANIIGLQQQEAALKEVNDTIKDIKIANKFLESQNPSGVYTISFTDEEGKKQRTEVTSSKSDIDAVITRYKNEKTNHILQLCKDYTLALDPEDNVVLGLANEEVEQDAAAAE